MVARRLTIYHPAVLRKFIIGRGMTTDATVIGGNASLPLGPPALVGGEAKTPRSWGAQNYARATDAAACRRTKTCAITHGNDHFFLR